MYRLSIAYPNEMNSPVPNCAPYNMAKAVVNHFARTLAIKLAPHRINVNVINPGWIDTPGERAIASRKLVHFNLETPRIAASEPC